MQKKEIRQLVMDIGHLTHVNDTDIGKTMDELNKLDSYKIFQQTLKDAKDGDRYKGYFKIICDLLGYKPDMDNTEIGFFFRDIALLKKKQPEEEEFD